MINNSANKSALATMTLLSILLPACGTLEYAKKEPAVPAFAYVILSDTVSTKTAITGLALAWLIYDPMAPNWNIEERQLGEQHYRLSLKQRGMHTGGDGEAAMIIKRRAEELMQEGGFQTYELRAYQEGIESTRPFAVRYAQVDLLFTLSETFPQL